MENTMQSIKSLLTPMVLAAALGVGFGFGAAPDTQAASATCRNACYAEHRECRASGDDPYLCRLAMSACLRACG
jgi:hypothetical protein